MTSKGHKGSFWGNKNILYLDLVVVAQYVHLSKLNEMKISISKTIVQIIKDKMFDPYKEIRVLKYFFKSKMPSILR